MSDKRAGRDERRERAAIVRELRGLHGRNARELSTAKRLEHLTVTVNDDIQDVYDLMNEHHASVRNAMLIIVAAVAVGFGLVFALLG